MTSQKQALTYVFSIALCSAAALFGSLFVVPNITTWYATLDRPFFAPPNWLFAPVWAVLYLCAAISFALVLIEYQRRTSYIKKITIGVFLVQLALNILWSVMFFGWHMMLGGGIEIIALWISLLISTLLFYRINKLAAWLLVPQLAWVFFAALLNWAFWILNRCTCGG